MINFLLGENVGNIIFIYNTLKIKVNFVYFITIINNPSFCFYYNDCYFVYYDLVERIWKITSLIDLVEKIKDDKLPYFSIGNLSVFIVSSIDVVI